MSKSISDLFLKGQYKFVNCSLSFDQIDVQITAIM